MAITLARLGLKTCSVDAVGSDIFGRFMAEELERFGVDTKHMKVYSGEEMFTISIVDRKGEGGTMIATPPSEPIFHSSNEMISFFKDMPRGKVFYLGHWFWPYLNLLGVEDSPKHDVLRSIKERGFSIVLDVNYKAEGEPSESEMDEFRRALKYVDVLLPNLQDARIIVGSGSVEETVRSLLGLGPEVVGLKLGDKGCYVASEEESARVPPFKVEVEDTTGAGDIFGGAFTYGWLKGWKVGEIGKFANAAAAFFISHQDLNEKFLTANQVHEFLKKERGTYG